DRPEIILRRHPAQVVEAGQVDGAAVATERALPGQVVIMLEIGHGELAERTVDGLAITQAGEFTGADGSPQPPAPEDGDHVVLVAYRGEVHDQRRVTLDPQRGGRQYGRLAAIGGPVPQA